MFSLVWNSFFLRAFGVAPTGTAEALSIPFQQTARAVRDHGNEMTPDEISSIDRLLDFDVIGTDYDPVISDPVKRTVSGGASPDDWSSYFTAWLKQLFEYPITYIEATVAGTYGYYAFTDEGYPSGGYGNCGMVILDGINKGIKAGFADQFDFSYVDALRPARNALELYYRTWHRLPLLSLTDTIPAYFWLIILYLVFMSPKGRRKLAIPAIAMVLAMLSCIASPVNGSFRYFAPIAASIPALLACCAACGGDNRLSVQRDQREEDEAG